MIDCENCIHVEMCKWCDEMVKNHTCDWYDECGAFEKPKQGEWIKDIRSMICEVNDYYGYTDSMHMFKVLFDQKYHGWIKRKSCPCDTCKHMGERGAIDPYGEPYCPIDHKCENASCYEKKEGDEE